MSVDRLRELPLWSAAVFAGVGLLLTFAGYRSMRMAARVASAFVFAAAGLFVGLHFQKPWLSIAAAAGLGTLGYLLGDAFYYLKVAANGGTAGAVLAVIGCVLLGRDPGPAAWLGGALAGGLLAVLFERPIGILGTSVIGAACLGVALGKVASLSGGLSLAVFAALAAAGCWTQAVTTRRLPPPTPVRKDPA